MYLVFCVRGKLTRKETRERGIAPRSFSNSEHLPPTRAGRCADLMGELASSCTPSKNSPRKHISERRQKHPVTFVDIQSLQLTARTLPNQHKIEGSKPALCKQPKKTALDAELCTHAQFLVFLHTSPGSDQSAPNVLKTQLVPRRRAVTYPQNRRLFSTAMSFPCFDKATRPACKGTPGGQF